MESGFFVEDQYIHKQMIDYFDIVQAFSFDSNGVTDGKMIPYDYEALKFNKRFKTLLKTYATQSIYFLKYTQNIKSSLQILIDDIDKELIGLEQ